MTEYWPYAVGTGAGVLALEAIGRNHFSQSLFRPTVGLNHGSTVVATRMYKLGSLCMELTHAVYSRLKDYLPFQDIYNLSIATMRFSSAFLYVFAGWKKTMSKYLPQRFGIYTMMGGAGLAAGVGLQYAGYLPSLATIQEVASGINFISPPAICSYLGGMIIGLFYMSTVNEYDSLVRDETSKDE